MLRFSLRVSATAIVLCGLSIGGDAQTEASDPVGFMTLTVPAAAPGGRAMSFRSLGLTRSVEFQGVASAVSVNPLNSPTPDSISAANPGWTANQFNGTNGRYYVELVGPTGAAGVGTTYDIASTVLTTDPNTLVITGTLTLAQRLADNVAGTPTFCIRKHWTIADAFGATNDKGLAGGSETTADLIEVYNTGSYVNGVFVPGAFVKYYYDTAAIGWRQTTDPATDVAGTVLYPDDGLLIFRQGTNTTLPTQVVLVGAVKLGQTSSPIVAGQNDPVNPYAGPMTLASSNLYTGDPATGLQGGFATTADQVWIYNGVNYDIYYYSLGGSPGVGWRHVTGSTTDMSGTPIQVGTSFILKRINSASFNWVSPQHPASLNAAGTINPLSIVAASSNNYALSWFAGVGRPYQLETSTDLISWAPFGTPVIGTGTVMTVNDAFPANQQKYYRLLSGAIRSGFDAVAMERSDDGYTHSGANRDRTLDEDAYALDPGQEAEAVPIGFQISLFGLSATELFVNNNGNLTFGTPSQQFTPDPIIKNSRPIIAPFWADVDTRGWASNVTRYGWSTVNGRRAFGVTWDGVGFYYAGIGKLNKFQVLLIDRSDVNAGDFDVEFNYEQIQWETGALNGGANGIGGMSARAGISNGSDFSFEIAGSGVSGSFLDTNPSSGLIHRSRHSSTLGRYVAEIRNGVFSDILTVDAGLDRTVVNSTTSLSGSVGNDGGRPLSYLWTQTSPASPQATISNPTQLTTAVTFPQAGVYTFSLAVSDGEVTVIDSVTVTLDLGVSAGPDQTVYTTVTLSGTVANGMGRTLTYQWSQVSGPATATISNANQLVASASLTAVGTYVFNLWAHDTQVSASDTVTVTFLQEPVPTFSPDGGVFTGIVQITMTCANPAATIRYTIDNTDPTSTTGTVYSGRFSLYQTATVRARAFQVGGITSGQMGRNFTVSKVTGTFTSTSQYAFLDTIGTLDWTHWGDTPFTPAAINRKAGVTAKISNYANVGTGTRVVYTNDARMLYWTGGTPIASSTSNVKGVYCVDLNQGFQITVPADTTERKLYLYLGGVGSAGTLTARASSSTTDDYTDTMSAIVSTAFDRNYVLTYHGTAANQTLTVKWVMSQKLTGGQVRLNGAALSFSP
jgi:hypothetical protein